MAYHLNFPLNFIVDEEGNVIPEDGGDDSGSTGFSAAGMSMMGGGIGMMASGVGSLTGGIMDIQAGKDLRDAGIAEQKTANIELAKLKASQPSLDTPSEYYDLVKGAYDQRLMQQRVEDINRSFATTAAAAGQYGARGLGAVLQASSQAEQAQRQEVLTQQRLQTQALGQLAKARERETRLKEIRSTRDIEYGFDAKRAAEAKEFMGEQQRREGITSTITGASEIVGGAAMTSVGAGFTGFASGGKIAKRGVRVTKTPGKFSHKENPLHVVDKGGDKVAELTGGEYVFNPDQSKKLLKMAKSGDTPLHKFVLNLLMKFENNG